MQESKAIFLKGIDNNKSLPEGTKTELKAIIAQQFQIMGQIIGTAELIYLRNKQ